MNKHIFSAIVGLLGLIGSYLNLFTRDHSNCTYPINHYLDKYNLGTATITEHSRCAVPKGLWFDYASQRGYYSIYDLKVVPFVPEAWVKDHNVDKTVAAILSSDIDNLYIIGKNNIPIEIFVDNHLPKKISCDYYTQFNMLVSKYNITYTKTEKEYITRVLLSCTHN